MQKTSKRQPTYVPRLRDQLCFPLYAASRLLTQFYRPVLEPYGLTYPQYLVLMVLWEKQGITVKDIGNLLYLDSGTLTPMLKKMQLAGFVERRRSQSDDRQVLNFLTKKGESLKAEAFKIPESMACNTAIPMEFAVELKKSLEKLTTLLHQNDDHKMRASS